MARAYLKRHTGHGLAGTQNYRDAFHGRWIVYDPVRNDENDILR